MFTNSAQARSAPMRAACEGVNPACPRPPAPSGSQERVRRACSHDSGSVPAPTAAAAHEEPRGDWGGTAPRSAKGPAINHPLCPHVGNVKDLLIAEL